MPTNYVSETGDEITIIVQDLGTIVEVGTQGPSGPQGLQGLQGPTGSQGSQGSQGIQGIPGTGAVVQDSTPLVGQLGELWFNSNTQVLKVYANADWQNQTQDDGYF